MELNQIIIYIISLVWFINGFFCKIFNLVPRHQEIVARILNEEYSREITIVIGILEVLMTIWILSGFKSRLNSITQISIIIAMNIIEFFFVKDLLMWGRLNIIFAFLFTVIIYCNEFAIKDKSYV